MADGLTKSQKDRYQRRIDRLKRDVALMWATRTTSWQQGHREATVNLTAQLAPEKEIARQRGYQQAVRDLAWKPTEQDYL